MEKFQAPDSMSEQIAQHLGKQIIKGELVAKDRIQELKVSADLGVSRGSVREALLILERRHLVNILPRKGAMVSELSKDNVNSLYTFYVTLLNMLMTELAVHWKDPQQLEPLIEKISTMERLSESSQDDKELILEAGFELMASAAKIVDNPYLTETLQNLQPAIHRTYFIAMQGRNDGIADSFTFLQNMAKGVVARDDKFLVESVKSFAEAQRDIVLQVLS